MLTVMSWLLTEVGQLLYDNDATGIDENLKEGLRELFLKHSSSIEQTKLTRHISDKQRKCIHS